MWKTIGMSFAVTMTVLDKVERSSLRKKKRHNTIAFTIRCSAKRRNAFYASRRCRYRQRTWRSIYARTTWQHSVASIALLRRRHKSTLFQATKDISSTATSTSSTLICAKKCQTNCCSWSMLNRLYLPASNRWTWRQQATLCRRWRSWRCSKAIVGTFCLLSVLFFFLCCLSVFFCKFSFSQ